jgi:aminopeptidase N
MAARKFVILVLLLLLVTAGCSRSRPSPLSVYAPAMKPAFRAELTGLSGMPRYDLTLNIAPDQGWLQGKARVLYRHTAPGEWHSLYFRLYPNLKRYGGSLDVLDTEVNGVPVVAVYEADRSALRVPMPTPLPPGKEVSIYFSYTLRWPQNRPGYTEFGESKGITMLPEAYPELAVPEPRPGGDPEWHLEMPASWGDVLFSESALYQVTATLPANMVVATGGMEITRTVSGPSATWLWVSGPSREFTLVMSPNFVTSTTEAYGTTVTSYFLPEDAEAAREAEHYAAAALRIYSDHLVPYPFQHFSLVESPLTYHGMEYSGMNALGIGLYRRYRNDLEFLTVHEVGHQWEYDIVGNDQVNHPWLDEGMVEFNTVLYYEAIYGKGTADLLVRRRWIAPYQNLKDRGLDATLEQPTTSYTKANYETLAYAKGALFFHALREKLGPDRYDRAIRAYLDRYRWKTATPTDLLEAVRESTGYDPKPLYEKWVLGK